MGKRVSDVHADGNVPLKDHGRPGQDAMDVDDSGKDMGEFEDDFEDEFESDDEIIQAGVDGRPDAEREAEEQEAMAAADTGTFVIGRTRLEPGHVLAPDPTAYEMLHSLSTPWPCLSFDLVRDRLGDDRKTYPAAMYTVAGTQAASASAKDNQLMVMKFSGLSRMDRGRDGSDDESGDDADAEDEDADPILESRSIPLGSTTNRVRAHQTAPSPPDPSAPPPTPTTLTAAMVESSHVLIHDVTPHLAAFDSPGTVIGPRQNIPVFVITAHKTEGYGIDWSPLHPAGRLATGDNDGLIYTTTRRDGGAFATDARPFAGHTGSVEEIQWSPSEQSVFASSSSDGTVRVWDVRSKSRRAALTVQVSDTDVNVLSWSRQTTHLLASGAEDGTWAVWDLRQWKGTMSDRPTPVASFDYHRGQQITSVEWHPTDDSVVAVAAADSTVTLWDLAVELDDEESKDTAGVGDVPPQLLFVHYLKDVKEAHWHPQIQGAMVATGGESFSIFRTITV